MIGAVGALVFQQVADILAPGNAEQPAAVTAVRGDLEIDEGRLAIVTNEYIGFLGKIVVHDTGPVESPQ